MDFADAIEAMMDARDAFKADSSYTNEQAYQAAKMVASRARSYDDDRAAWGGY